MKHPNQLTTKQRAAIDEDNPTVAIVAPAGSGKTTVLTQRIARRIESKETPPGKVVAVSFTRAAAYQIGERVSQLIDTTPINVGTFHSIALSTIKRFAEFEQRATPSIVLDTKQVLKELLDQAPPSQRQAFHYTGNASKNTIIKKISAEISWAKSCTLDPQRYADVAPSLRQVTHEQAEVLSQVFSNYESYKTRHRLMDVDDLVTHAAIRLQQNKAFAQVERFLFRHFYVDEFQDANRSQIELLIAYLGESRDVSVVGDPSQSIYGWNGAIESNMSDFIDTFPEATVVVLSDNFRCTPEIVFAASKIMPIVADERIRYQVNPTRPSDSSLGVVFHHLKDEREEALVCARTINSLHEKNVPYSAMAVLSRTNAQLHIVEEVFSSLRVPTKSPGGTNSTFSRYLKLFTKHWTAEELQRRVATLLAHLSESQEPRSNLSSTPPAGLLQALLRLRRVQPEISVAETIEVIDKVRESSGGHDAVTLTTFHGAKGLEWYHVHLIGVDRSRVSSVKARQPQVLKEEQRLLYVAMTRASDSLHISFTSSAKQGTSPPWSSLLDPLEEQIVGRTPDTTPTASPREDPLKRSSPFNAQERAYKDLTTKINLYRAQEAQRRGLLPEEYISNSDVRLLVKNVLNGSFRSDPLLTNSSYISESAHRELLDFLGTLDVPKCFSR